MRFEFATAARIIFGPGSLRDAAPAAAKATATSDRPAALIVSGRSDRSVEPLSKDLETVGLAVSVIDVKTEPTIAMVEEGVKLARQDRCGVVIGFGGGSAIDAAKAIAAMTTNDGRLLDYLEVIGQGRALSRPPLPCIAIPTTAGTGAEVTRNAVLTSPEHRVKASLRSPMLLPTVAIVDPELTGDLPPAVTAATGLDALTQLIEAFVCSRANPMTDGICREGIERAAGALPRAYHNGHDAVAREHMALASLFGGLALANAGLGAVHGLAAPIGGTFSAPHGAICAALLPHVMAANVYALRQRRPNSGALPRYDAIGQLVTGRSNAIADDAIEWARQLCSELAIPPLRTYGLTTADVPALIEKGQAASSMKANPVALTAQELSAVLNHAL